jgi:nucleoid-associated protein YgaU
MRSGDLILNIEGGEGGGEETYTVKSGDSLSKIGQHYGVAWREIYEANKETIGDDPDRIRPGQQLRIPKKQ